MDYDLMTSDDIMAETFFALSDLDAIKKHKAASVSDAAKSATAPTETAADEDEYVSGGVPLSLAARNPKTGDVMKVSESVLDWGFSRNDSILSAEMLPRA